MSLLSIVASSSAFLLPASPPPKGSSIDSDWSTKNKKQPGFLRLISASYAMVSLHDRRINSAANSEGHAGARNPYRSHVNFAPPAHPSAGAIGTSLVVNCRAINSRRPALETFQRIDLIDFVDEPRPRRPSARRNHLCVLGCGARSMYPVTPTSLPTRPSSRPAPV